jgi:iron transport multicopper oxidase
MFDQVRESFPPQESNVLTFSRSLPTSTPARDFHSLVPCEPTNTSTDATASITYNASAPLTDLGFATTFHDVPDLTLSPIPAEPLLPPASRTLDVQVSFDTWDDGTNRASFNGESYMWPLVPAVFSALTLGENATVERAYGPLSFVIAHGEVVDILLKNGDAGKHPLSASPRFISL